jgi:hypothetical protein
MGSEPRTLDEALQGPNAKEWQAAYDYKISQLVKMGVFTVEDLLEGEPVLLYSLVFKEKLGPDGNINSWQVQLVAGGHKQSEGVNCDETFSFAAINYDPTCGGVWILNSPNNTLDTVHIY